MEIIKFETQIPVKQNSFSWIEDLALEEISMEESGIIQFNDHLDGNALLEEESIKLMSILRDLFESYSEKFNEFRGNAGTRIRIFKISNTINDFMLFRNSLKLVVARKARDTISIGFLSNTGVFAARLNAFSPIESGIHEIKAKIGVFNKVSWEFQGEKVDLETLARHYLTEFIKHSAQ